MVLLFYWFHIAIKKGWAQRVHPPLNLPLRQWMRRSGLKWEMKDLLLTYLRLLK